MFRDENLELLEFDEEGLFELRERLRSGESPNGFDSLGIFGIEILEKECRCSANSEFGAFFEIGFYFRQGLSAFETLLEFGNIDA